MEKITLAVSVPEGTGPAGIAAILTGAAADAAAKITTADDRNQLYNGTRDSGSGPEWAIRLARVPLI